MALECHFLSRSRWISGALKRFLSPWRMARTRLWPARRLRTEIQMGRFAVSHLRRPCATPRVRRFSGRAKEGRTEVRPYKGKECSLSVASAEQILLGRVLDVLAGAFLGGLF